MTEQENADALDSGRPLPCDSASSITGLRLEGERASKP
jgi:hypothetical protein